MFVEGGSITAVPLTYREQRSEVVKKAAETLDRLYRGWYSEIDVAKLNLESARWCVLGQTTVRAFGVFKMRVGYRDGVDAFREAAPEIHEKVFLFNDYRPAWQREILLRQAR